MSLPQLIIELLIDLIAIGLGITLMFRAKDNYPRLYWGVIVAFIGVIIAWENIGWISIVKENPQYEFTDLLNIEKMLKWYLLASLISLFPIASLRPGYLNHIRIMAFMLPSILVITVGICYLCFNGDITQVYSMTQLFSNIGHFDVKLRIVIFLFSIVTPLMNFLYPVVKLEAYRKINKQMYLFVCFMFLLLGIYIYFTLDINAVVFNALGIIVVNFGIFFSILYLRSENPFSVRVENESKRPSSNSIQKRESEIAKDKPTTDDISLEIDTRVHPFFYEIDAYLKNHKCFTTDKYCIDDLSKTFSVKDSVISAAVKSCGYTNFKEYLNLLRMDYFKQLATKNPKQTIKELMNNSGFTSRTTFYRIFKDQYGLSPTEFIDNQLK